MRPAQAIEVISSIIAQVRNLDITTIEGINRIDIVIDNTSKEEGA